MAGEKGTRKVGGEEGAGGGKGSSKTEEGHAHYSIRH